MEIEETLAPIGYGFGAPDLDDVQSFIVRLHLNPAPGGRGNARPQFTLEHVNLRTSRRLRTLEEVVNELSGQVELILRRWKCDAG